MFGSGSSSTPSDTNPTTQGPTDEKQQKINELIADLSNMTFEDSSLPSLAKKILSDELEELLHGLIGLRKLLSREENSLIQAAIDANTVPRLIALLSKSSSTNKVKMEAAWCLTNLCSGSTEQIQSCIHQGVIPAFLKLLKVKDHEVVEQSVWGLGNIAGDSPQFRDKILNQSGVELLVNALKNAPNVSLKRNGAWALSNFCRGKPLPSYSLVCGAIPFFADLLKSEEDEQTLNDIAWALAYLTANEQGVESFLAQNAVPNLIQYLSHHSAPIVSAILRTIGNIVSGTEQQTSIVIKEKNFLPELFKLAQHKKKVIKKEVFWTISNITAGTPVQFEGIMGNPDYVNIIIHVAKNDIPDVSREAVWALSNLTISCTPAQISRILNNGVFSCFLSLLSQSDTKILQVALEGIQNCLKWGQQFNLNDEHGENRFVAEIENQGALDILENLQTHQDNEVYKKSLAILESYFACEEEEEV